jgi:asparagine synthase (glutamine-hydrolysing)
MADSMLDEDFAATLDARSYVRDRYAQAVAEVPHLDGADKHERRMREICYLHLTRFVRMLLDRKDRMSMAVGLEVRVPFCDHRLVEYVFNTPWSLKTFDGREKSLLRAATAEVLPESVVRRRKSPYPSTQDQQYVSALAEQVRDVVAMPDSPVFDMFDRRKVAAAVALAPTEVAPGLRAGFERILDLAVWLDIRHPVLKLSLSHPCRPSPADTRRLRMRGARARLAARAGVRRAVHERLAANRAAAARARPPGLAVDGKRAVEVAGLPVDVDIQRVE